MSSGIGGTSSVPPVGSTGAASSAAKEAELRRVAKEFEAVFLRQILASMGRATHASSSSQSGDDGGVYGSMVVGAMADAVAQGGGMGLADVLVRSLLASHEPNARSGSSEIAPDHLKASPVRPFSLAEPKEVSSTDGVKPAATAPKPSSVRRER